jgi:hypothetical protein
MEAAQEARGVEMSEEPIDEVDAEMAAIAAQRAAGIRTVGAAVATFLVVAFIGEFTLAEPIHLGEFELHRGYAYLFAPLAALIAGIGVFLRFRPKGGSFLDDTSLIASEAGGPRDAEAEAVAGLASGRKAVQAKVASFLTFAVGAVVGHVGVSAYYDYLNEHRNDDPYEYVPLQRLQIGETLVIVLVSAVLAFVVYKILAPAKAKVAAEVAELDADTGALYGDIRRKSRQATIATFAGGLVGLLVGFGVFYGLFRFLDARSAFDLRVLGGAALAGVLVGGGLRTLLLPDSMREEGPLDFASLPAGDPGAIATAIGSGFTLSRRSSPLDLVGLGTHAPARYDLFVGDGVEGFITEAGGPLAALALGGQRPLTLIISDGESRAIHLDKGAFGGELAVRNGSGQTLGKVRRSRLPFVNTIVVELGGEKLTLRKRLCSKSYVLRTAQGEAAEARTRRVKDDVGLETRQVDVTVAAPELAMAALIGTLAMDAI